MGGDELSVAMVRAALEAGQRIRIRLWGHSMRPLVPGGSQLWIEPLGARGLRVGDIAAHVAGEALTAHRVVEIDGARVAMAGDSDGRASDVRAENVLGRVEGVVVLGRQLRASPGIERAANRALLFALPGLRVTERGARGLARGARSALARAAGPWLIERMRSELRAATAADLSILEATWRRRARRCDAAQKERWRAGIERREVLVWIAAQRLLAYADLGPGGERYVSPSVRSPGVEEALSAEVRRRQVT